MALIILIWFAWPCGVVVHELGHAVAAWLIGQPPRLISVGTGRPLMRIPLGRAWLVLHAVLTSGYMENLPGRRTHLSWGAVLLAGAGANLGVAAILFGLPAAGLPREALPLLAAGQVIVALWSLVPRQDMVDGRPWGTDTYQLFWLLRRPVIDYLGPPHEALLRRAVPVGPLPPPSPASAEIVYQISRTDRMSEPWACRDVSRVLLRVAGRTDLPAEERSLLLAFLASNELMFGGTGVSLAQLDAFSQEAVHLAPGPTVRMVRGGVLAALRRGEEAKAMLLTAEQDSMMDSDRALCRAYLAIAAALLGDVEGMRSWNRTARAVILWSDPVMHEVLDRLQLVALSTVSQQADG